MTLHDPPLNRLPAGQLIVIGADSRLVNLYRGAANQLKTDADVAIDQRAMVGDGTGNLASILLNISATATGSMGLRYLIAGTEQWRLYMAGSNDKHIYLRDMANARMHVTFTQGATAALAVTQFGSAVTVDDALTAAGLLTASAGLTVTGTVTGAGFTKTLVGLSNVDNTSDANKPVSTAQATANALALAKASNLSDLASVATAKTNLALVKGDVGLGNVDNTSDTNKPVSTAQAAADALKLAKASNLSDLASVATAKTNLALVKGDVGLGNVDNTSDAAKPVSTAQAAADALALAKASNLSDLANVATAKTNLALVKGDVGLGNVDNTSDAAKPVSTLQAAAVADVAIMSMIGAY